MSNIGSDKIKSGTFVVQFSDEIVCEKCGNPVNKLEYDRHLKSHKEKRVETCNICFRKFTNLSNFKYHVSHHSKERNWVCDECPKSYKTKIDLLQHKRVHDKVKEPYSCQLCGQQFTVKSKYNAHMKNHNIAKEPQKCEICDKFFVNLRSHIQQVHQKIRNHKCSICSREFGKRSGLVRHIATVHEKVKSWSCDLCQKSFGEKAQLLRHRKIHFKGNKNKSGLKVLKQNNNDKLNQSESSQNFSDVESGAHETTNCEENSGIVEEIFVIPLQQHDDDEIKSNLKIEKIECADTIEVLDEFRDSIEADLNNELKCHLCSFTFKHKRYYQSHIQTVHNNGNNKSLECSYCYEKFTHRTQRLRHVRQNHPEVFEENCNDELSSIVKSDKDVSSRTCLLCNKIFKKIKYLEIHQASVHNSEIFECDICHRKFSFKASMERHIKSVHEDRRDFKCQEWNCMKAFRSRYELNEHFKNIHDRTRKNEPLENVTCDICYKICSSKKALYSHKKVVHEKVKWNANFECKICFEKFDSKYKKIKHLNQVHKNGEIDLRTCHLCSLNFQYYDDFKAHIETHEGYFICMICGHNFNDESSLFIHKETHKKIEEEFRQFICDICSHRLSTKAQLQIHMRNHTSENKYVCDECGKSYKFLAPFLHHKIVHKNKYEYNCSYCPKAFRKMRDKILHEKTHSGVRPYKCQLCEKTFALKPNYTNHMKTHQVKYFECKICHVHQSSSAKLRQHEINEHPEEFPFKCLNCSKLFKTSHTYEDHKEKCVEKLNFVT